MLALGVARGVMVWPNLARRDSRAKPPPLPLRGVVRRARQGKERRLCLVTGCDEGVVAVVGVLNGGGETQRRSSGGEGDASLLLLSSPPSPSELGLDRVRKPSSAKAREDSCWSRGKVEGTGTGMATCMGMRSSKEAEEEEDEEGWRGGERRPSMDPELPHTPAVDVKGLRSVSPCSSSSRVCSWSTCAVVVVVMVVERDGGFLRCGLGGGTGLAREAGAEMEPLSISRMLLMSSSAIRFVWFGLGLGWGVEL